MPVDLRYGKVTLENQPESMADDEPVVVFRAQDKVLPALLRRYRTMCMDRHAKGDHLTRIGKVIEMIDHWQATHKKQVKIPD